LETGFGEVGREEEEIGVLREEKRAYVLVTTVLGDVYFVVVEGPVKLSFPLWERERWFERLVLRFQEEI